MTTRSCATWDEVKTNPFFETISRRSQGRPRRRPGFEALYGGRGCATTASGRRRPRFAAAPWRSVWRCSCLSFAPPPRRHSSAKCGSSPRCWVSRTGSRSSPADTGNPEDVAQTAKPARENSGADPGERRDDLRQRRHRRLSRLAGGRRQGHPERAAGALPLVDPAGAGGRDRRGGGADPLRNSVARAAAALGEMDRLSEARRSPAPFAPSRPGRPRS